MSAGSVSDKMETSLTSLDDSTEARPSRPTRSRTNLQSSSQSLSNSVNAGSDVDSLSSSHNSSLPAESRRHSTRSVKRRKFDDELVESSLHHHKQERQRTISKTPSEPGDVASKATASETSSTAPLSSTSSTRAATRSVTAAVSQSDVTNVPNEKISASQHKPSASHQKSSEKKKISSQLKVTAKNTPKTKLKKQRKQAGAAQISAMKSLGRWKPQDDLLLVEAVQQTSDLKSVHLGVKFSCNFTLRDIEDRWYTLLYNEKVSKLAMTAIQQLPNDEVVRIKSKALFSKQEEELLSTITVASQPTSSTFSNLLKTNVGKFHPARTCKSLMEHWTLMKQYHVLPDMSIQPLPRGDHILNFSDAEEMLDDKQLSEPASDAVQREMILNDKKQKKEIKILEQELPKWQVLVESITGVSQPDFDNQTLAILRGRLVRYLMRSKEISIGRATKDNQVDVDLSLEGPSYKISRRQGSIKLRNSGEFILTNIGKRPIYVDSKPILSNGKVKLHHNSVIEITCLRFIFLVNQELIKNMKTDIQKTLPPTTT